MDADVINRNINKPIYKQIEDVILTGIKNDKYKAGEVIPSERELSEKLNVSRYTIRKAIEELVNKGYLYRKQGNGTFVYGKEPSKARKSNQIGVILPYQKGVGTEIMQGIEMAVQETNYRLTVFNSSNDTVKEVEGIQMMKKEGVDGLIIYPADGQKDSNIISDLKRERFPFVLIDRRLQYCETDCVMSDNIEGAYQGTEYLIKLGHERIAFITNEFIFSSIEDRILGYKSALNRHEIGFDNELLFSYKEGLDRKEINTRLYDFINAKKPTAIFALHDTIALDIVKMCRERDISIPEDLSLICFDHTDIVKHLEVPLTTVIQLTKEIGYKAVKLLIDKISNKNNKTIQQIYFPTEFIIRGSCIKRNK
jgi:GntR family transcriptional regulator, arabinose operon transcriptional repressor